MNQLLIRSAEAPPPLLEAQRVRRRAAGCRAARGLGPNRLQVKPETQFRWAEERAFDCR